MERRNFFKGLAGVIAGLAIAPIVIKEIKETQYDFNDWEKGVPDGWEYGIVHPLTFQAVPIDYEIGDKITSIDNPKVIGTCTGFMHDNTCVTMNNKCWGGKYYFRKA